MRNYSIAINVGRVIYDDFLGVIMGSEEGEEGSEEGLEERVCKDKKAKD